MAREPDPSAKPSVLSTCEAILVGRTPAHEQFLAVIARSCGFGSVATLGSTGTVVDGNAISFVLVHYLLGDALLDAVIKSIRSGSDGVRFSPIVLISDDCPFERVLSYIQLGCDDVISLPEKKEVMVQRFGAQLNTEHLYVETSSYFGPDRRRMDVELADSRRTGMAGHSRFYFARVAGSGIKILRHQIFASAGRPIEVKLPR